MAQVIAVHFENVGGRRESFDALLPIYGINEATLSQVLRASGAVLSSEFDWEWDWRAMQGVVYAGLREIGSFWWETVELSAPGSPKETP